MDDIERVELFRDNDPGRDGFEPSSFGALFEDTRDRADVLSASSLGPPSRNASGGLT